jgi:hypothetical protein
MILPTKPFELAERYIQLRKKCAPDSWTDTMSLISDMIVMPIIILFLALTGQPDPMTTAMTGLKAYQTWKDYTEYIDLRFQVQMMLVYCQSVGGPFITTNDPKYMPYVLADAVQRKNQDLPTK